MSPAGAFRIACSCLVVLAVSFAVSVRAQGAPAPAGDPEKIAPSAVTPAPAAMVRTASGYRPMVAEMRAVLEAERVRLAALHEKFRIAPDAMAALAVQREIEQLELGTEIALLRIQVDHARRAGRSGQAAELEKVIAELLAPPVRVSPAPSTGPQPASR